ncbi:DUF3857 domain-containing transglutaminase family protein [Flagellimonas nanhaiensis]|uniref:DUF3857 domain-containing protein n=1 Tax=Flagellimonas nanhaiensis TaxID=2292706 RepID=A0A371JNQ5_9FLAO|nr:DUF3857 and transglutaminase domain-containing protein [Allomuricauda nanhaiensis]RDY58864.1 DUF3857 domain-containing protein [Allomuricauda nanhaiensis]
MRVIVPLLLFLGLQFSFSQDYSYHNIPEELLKNADAVVRLDEMSIVVTAQDQMHISSKRVVTVLNEQGNRYIHAFAFYDDNDKINSLEAKIYNKQGEEVKKIKKRDFLDQSAVAGGTLYSDSRVLFMRYTSNEYPYTVEFTKTYTTPDTAFAPPWSFLDGYRVSVEKSKYSFKVECGIPFRHKESNFDAFPIEMDATTNQVSYSGTNIKALKREPLSPPFAEFAPNVKIALDRFHLEGVNGSASNWKEFGKWIYDKLILGRDQLAPETINKVRKLVKDINDPYEKVRKIYEYVQDNTRYISVQLGIGGWMPISAEEVDRVKYGDCKGLSNYTMALLNVVGIESFYTVLHAGGQMRHMDPDFTSMEGNHAFLNVPIDGKDLWLECTSQITPVNHLGTFSDNRNVLKITPNGGEIVKTHQYLDEESYQHTKAEIFASVNGSVKGNVEILSKGIQYNQKFRHTIKSALEKEEFYKDYWGYINNLSLGEITFKNDREKIEFLENVEISAEGYLSETDGKLLFSPNLVNRDLQVPERSRNRKRDLLISRGYLDEDEFVIHIPQGYKPETLLPPTKLETKFGSYEISIEETEQGILVYKRRFLAKSGRYTKEDYKLYRDFRKQVARYDNSRIILTKI